jgi:WD40 repeat protein
VIALALAALALGGCPRDAGLGTLTYDRGGTTHVVSFADCSDRSAGRAPSPAAAVPAAVTRHLTRLVGPLPKVDGGLRQWPEPLSVSPDGRWVLWARALASASITADGLPLAVTSLASGRTRPLGAGLAAADYASWCGSTLVVTLGRDRIATHDKRLVAARPPDWTPRLLWRAPGRAFGSMACAHGGGSVVVLSQPASTDARFFDTHWQLWQVGLDGKRKLLDAPPSGSADESPLWSPDGSSLLFVRERRGYGRAVLLRHGTLSAVTSLGYSLGFYGHHDWWVGATWRA